MRNVLVIFLLGFLASCSTPKGENQVPEERLPAEEKSEKVADKRLKVLNPNLASSEELTEVPGLSSELTEEIIEGRPYLSSVDFIEKLTALVGEDRIEEAKKSLFLPMNLNTEAEPNFMLIPEVGKKMAHEFEEYRPYTSWEQFRREIGKYVDEEQVARYEQYVFIPVNLNTATKDEIMRIPGMGKKMLHEFEEYRPYENMEQFRREIGKYVDEDELARLERYVTL